MFIECVNKNGTPYLRLVKSVIVRNEDGVRVCRKKHVLSIGPLSRFDDGEPDYVERLKKSFDEGSPLIPALLPYCNKETSEAAHHLNVKDGSPYSVAEPRYCADLLLERFMEELGLSELFASCKDMEQIEYDIYGFAKLLIFHAVLDNSSDEDVLGQNDIYFRPVVEDFNPDNVYDALDFLYDHKTPITNRINKRSGKRRTRKTANIIYYSVMNFISEAGNESVTEEENNSAIQMGLFTDSAGIPAAAETIQGDFSDSLTLLNTLRYSIDKVSKTRFILVADSSSCSCHDLLHMTDSGNGYIVSDSLKNCNKEEQNWAYDDEGYVSADENFRYKSRITKKAVKDENENIRVIEEKVIVYQIVKYAKNRRTQDSPDKETQYHKIMTSELTMDELEVTDKYYGMKQIKNQFCYMMENPEARPDFIYTAEQITAYAVICMIALTILRLIQTKTAGSEKADSVSYWNSGMSFGRIQKALRKWGIEEYYEDLYRFVYINDPDIRTILDALNIKIPAKLYNRAESEHITTDTEISV